MVIPTRYRPYVEAFFHQETQTFSYVVYEGEGGAAAIIDSVLDYDAASARTSTTSADTLLTFIREHALHVEWILETHAHADHVSAGAYLKQSLGMLPRLAIGRGITQVQSRFKTFYGYGEEFAVNGQPFDHLFQDADEFLIGKMQARVMATPGHTDDSLTYVVGDAAFIGDTLFAPDTGTARCDFPGGNAARLYSSIQKILSLPIETRIFLCHDYPSDGRMPEAETTIAAQIKNNIHIGREASEAEFVTLRNARDAGLPHPRLMLPSLQINLRAGHLPAPDENGIAYLRLPLNQLEKKA
jgi:glyoxylase-like metal-dependent hydrolase (beta-lactamase superfamily II)